MTILFHGNYRVSYFRPPSISRFGTHCTIPLGAYEYAFSFGNLNGKYDSKLIKNLISFDNPWLVTLSPSVFTKTSSQVRDFLSFPLNGTDIRDLGPYIETRTEDDAHIFRNWLITFKFIKQERELLYRLRDPREKKMID